MSKKFTELMNSYTSQAADGGCLMDYTDYFHDAVLGYFRKCENENITPTIEELKKEIVINEESDLFQFK